MDRQMADGRRFAEVDGQLMFLRDDYGVRFC
jgi:adenine-specific DNA-methyltransferase